MARRLVALLLLFAVVSTSSLAGARRPKPERMDIEPRRSRDEGDGSHTGVIAAGTLVFLVGYAGGIGIGYLAAQDSGNARSEGPAFIPIVGPLVYTDYGGPLAIFDSMVQLSGVIMIAAGAASSSSPSRVRLAPIASQGGGGLVIGGAF